ncbi:hypothetical protein COOONC_03335 [Cooperia oncophora]
MKRLLFAIVVVGLSVLACQPVKKPTVVGGGNQTASVKLITVAEWDPKKAELYLKLFPLSHIKPYSKELGKFSDLGAADVGGKFAYTFTLHDADCHKVQLWMKEILNGTHAITAAPVECTH